MTRRTIKHTLPQTSAAYTTINPHMVTVSLPATPYPLDTERKETAPRAGMIRRDDVEGEA